jgi:predicted short-subunit dehydrogenase-like oxidoreductase (DUF2520 family)
MSNSGSKRIGFIGAGRIGCSLSRYISENGGDGFSVSGFFSRNPESAAAAAVFAGGRVYGRIGELAADSDMLLLTVPDGQIAGVWASAANEIAGCAGRERERLLFVGHLSGCLSGKVFSPRPGAMSFGSMHPVLSVPGRENCHEIFKGAFFTAEGDPDFVSFAGRLLSALGNPWRPIETDRKALYHAACVMVSNLVNALAYTGEKMFDDCGFDSEFAEQAWRGLFAGNAENISALGPVDALTGPVERGDTETVRSHLETLTGHTRDIYLFLSRALIETAERKNPGRDYSDLASLLTE